jgi:hypothetical protein
MDSQVSVNHGVDIRVPRCAFLDGDAGPDELLLRVSSCTAGLPLRLPFLADKS